MKKLLGLLAATGMVASTGTGVVSCTPKVSDNQDPSSMTLEQLKTKYDEYMKSYESFVPQMNEIDSWDNPTGEQLKLWNDFYYLVAQLNEISYLICLQDNKLLPDEWQINSKEELVESLSAIVEPDMKSLFNEDTLNFINTLIEKYSK